MESNGNVMGAGNSPTPPKQPQPMAQNLSEFKQIANTSDKSPNGRNKKIILGVLAVVVIGLSVAGGAFLLTNQNKEQSNNENLGEDTEEVARFDEAGNRLITEECPEIIYPAGDASPYQEYLELSFRFNTCAWELNREKIDNPNAEEVEELPQADLITLTHKEVAETTLTIRLTPFTGPIGFGPSCGEGEFEALRDAEGDGFIKLGRYVDRNSNWSYTPSMFLENLAEASADYCYSGPFISALNFPDPSTTGDLVFPQDVDYIYPSEYRTLSIVSVVFEGDDSMIKDADFVVSNLVTQQPFENEVMDETVEDDSNEDLSSEPTPSAPDKVPGEYENGDGTTEIVLDGTFLGFSLPTQDIYEPLDLSAIPTPEIAQYTDNASEWYYDFELFVSIEPIEKKSVLLIGYSPNRSINYPCGPGCLGDSFMVVSSYEPQSQTDLTTYIQSKLKAYEGSLEITEQAVSAFPNGKRVTYTTPIENRVEYWVEAAGQIQRLEFYGSNSEEVLSEVYDTFRQNIQ